MVGGLPCCCHYPAKVLPMRLWPVVAALLMTLLHAPVQAATLAQVRGRTVQGEVLETQGMWRGKPLVLVFWSVADPASVRLLKESRPALERAGYAPLGVHPDHPLAKVQEALRTVLSGWDSLPDTGFALSGKLGVRGVPALAAYSPAGGWFTHQGEREVRQWLRRLSARSPDARGQTQVSLNLQNHDRPLLLSTFAAIVESAAGVELFEVKAGHRRLLLKGKVSHAQADARLGRALVLMQNGQLWSLNLRGEKTLLASTIAAFCLREKDGLLGVVRRDGAVATHWPGAGLGRFDNKAHATGCGFAADGGALVVVQ